MYYKYEIEKEQVSYDNGQTWTDTYATRVSSYSVGAYETLSECEGGEPPVEPIYRTVSGSPYCDGYDKKEDLYNQVSYDNGSTWQNVSSSTTVIEYNSEDCGYVPPTPPTPSGDLSKPLTLEIVSGGSISLSWGEYSLDNGATWNSVYTGHEVLLNLNVGDKVLLRGDRSQNPYIYRVVTQNSTAYYKVYNNFNSMITPVGFENITTLQYGYSNAFANTNVVDASGLLLPCTTLTVNDCYGAMFEGCSSLITPPALPATTLSQDCYRDMFERCTSLTVAPELPATTLADYCYEGMFAGCTSLTTAPVLPATTLTQSCYYNMFQDCTSLTTAPELPATTLANYCYLQMFSGCTSLRTAQQILPATTLTNSCYNHMFYGCTRLTTAPVLPATTLTYSCYAFMFAGCTSLTTAPDLPAPTLAERCYYELFNGCTSLNYIKCLATNISATNCTRYFTLHVASSGTFVKAASMRSWQRNSDGIPTGWTVQNA